jgi:hypothetical protein
MNAARRVRVEGPSCFGVFATAISSSPETMLDKGRITHISQRVVPVQMIKELMSNIHADI